MMRLFQKESKMSLIVYFQRVSKINTSTIVDQTQRSFVYSREIFNLTRHTCCLRWIDLFLHYYDVDFLVSGST